LPATLPVTLPVTLPTKLPVKVVLFSRESITVPLPTSNRKYGTVVSVVLKLTLLIAQ
jgi:hypothetical protein